jgi:hypothetical protein
MQRPPQLSPGEPATDRVIMGCPNSPLPLAPERKPTMPRPAPSTAREQPKHAKQTGPRTLAGKARSKMNAARHGLRSSAAVLPGEDPEEYAAFVTGVVEDLVPVGPLEEDLARRIAAARWRLRRIDGWVAARARLAAQAVPKDVAAKLAAADAEIVELRAGLAGQQRDPAADPPFEATLLSLPEDTPVDPLDVTALWLKWADDVSDEEAASTLEQVCDRAGLPEAVASQPGDSPGWSAGLVRRLVAEFARELDMTVEAYLAEPVEEWKAGLADERIRRRQRRAGVKRQIAEIEQHKRDLVTDRSGPDAAHVDLLTRYEAGALRAFERDLKALRILQEARLARDRRGKPTE